jgi:hypothetical protein
MIRDSVTRAQDLNRPIPLTGTPAEKGVSRMNLSASAKTPLRELVKGAIESVYDSIVHDIAATVANRRSAPLDHIVA